MIDQNHGMELEASAPPRDRIRAVAQEYGEPVVAGWCILLLAGAGPAAVPREAATALGGRHAQALLADAHPDQQHWWRVWGARGLLYAWHDTARATLWAALDDEAWRVREAALRVVARRRLDEHPQSVADRLEDPVRRVRAAADRALVRIGSA